jgi:L-asparaginase
MHTIILANSVGGVGMPVAVEALCTGQAALDVIEAGIRSVEADPNIHSVGRGGWPNLLGELELDASIMNGRTRESGAVAALMGYLYPISVARQVMERLPHVFLAGEGAARFAAEIGAEAGENVTEDSRRGWEEWLRAHVPEEVRAKWPDVPLIEWARLTADPETAGGTTTWLVRDAAGDIAAGVSTSGWAYKYPGRLGDSPVIGAGCYADNRYGAAVCTGMGELTIRAGTARAIVLYMKMGATVQEACHEAVADLRGLKRKYRGSITIYALDRDGQPYVVAIRHEGTQTYWLWAEGMEKPEERAAVVEKW